MNRAELEQAFTEAKAAGDFENAYKIEQQMQSAPVDFDAMTAVKNIPSSAVKMGKEMYHAVTNPIDTGKAVMELGGALADKTLRNWQGWGVGGQLQDRDNSEAAANAMGQFYKDRYGSMDALKQTAMDDPVGALLDASMVVSPARSLSKVPAVTKGLATVDPINAAARAGQTALKAIPEGTAARLYDSSAKFSNRPGFDRNAAINTALEQGILPTFKGVRKVENRVQILDSMLDDLIIESGKAGNKIPVAAVEQHLNALRSTKGGFRMGRSKDLEKIDKMLETWHKDLADLGNGAKITHVSPEFIQNFKKSAYGDVSWKAKNPGAKRSQVSEDFYKTMGRGAKDEIVKAIPEATEINKLLGDLLEMQPELIRAAGRIDKHNLIGLDTSVKTGAGAAIGTAADATGLGAGLGFAMSMLGNPRIKPRIAIALKRLRDGDVKWIDQNIGDPAVRAALVLAGRAEEIVNAPNYDAEANNQSQQQGITNQYLPQQ